MAKKEKVIPVSKLKKYLMELGQREKLIDNTIKHTKKSLANAARGGEGAGLLVEDVMHIKKLEGQVDEIGTHIMIIDTLVEAAEDR